MNICRKVRHFFSGYFSELLLFVLLLFIFRPVSDEPVYIGIWKFFFTLVFLGAIFNCHHPRPIKITALCLGLPAMGLTWFSEFMHNTPILFLASNFITLIFLLLVTASVLYQVVLGAKVTLDTLRGAICAYFLMAFSFSFIYVIIEIIHPGSFHIPQLTGSVHYHYYLSQMMYFSFQTILAIGYGDITASGSNGQTFAILEAILGQFYIGIIVARLVSVYSYYQDKVRGGKTKT